jgi:hypothetical protein
MPVKVVLAGGRGAGKTTFIATLSDVAPLAPAADDGGPALALDFGRIAIDASLLVYLFATPDHDRFAFAWDGLVGGALGAIVLVDAQCLEGCFPALDYLENREVPFIVAVNRFDSSLHHDLDEIRDALSLDPDVAVVTTDARDRHEATATVFALLESVLSRAMAMAQSAAG